MPARTMYKILDRDAPILRQSAKAVPIQDIGSKKLGDIISAMKKALNQEEDGVAIAAPQIGVGLRIFVVSARASAIAKNKKAEENAEDMVFINPEIVKVSKSKKKMEEGCLSVRWLYGFVERHEKITVKALNEKGEPITAGASGLMAQIFQHEIDHLNGVLFTDTAENLRDLPPQNNGE